MKVTLDPTEISVLDRQDPNTEGDGGFQRFLVGLQKRVDRSTGEIDLDVGDLEKIQRYAFNYGNGGWEGRLKAIFARELGPDLKPQQSATFVS